MMMKIICLVLLLSTAVAARKHKKQADEPECMWHGFLRHDNISAWEFQAQPHRHMIRDRDKAIKSVERVLQQLTDDPNSGVQFVPHSRYMAIFREVSFQVSDRHGHPIHRDPDKPKEKPFPWKGLGYLRIRLYKLLTPAGAYIPSAMPGMADLTFKMKLVDPDLGPGNVQLPKMVGAAKLTAKVESDLHCDHGRSTMSPLYRPVSQSINISKIANVREYFPNLAQVARLSEDEVLPFMHEVHRAKIVWTVVYKGVVGEANLVIKYNTTFEDAVAGAHPKNGELSLRIRREVASATGTAGKKATEKLYAALDALADAMQVFRDNGWDGKTPSLPKKKDENHDHEGGRHSEHHSEHHGEHHDGDRHSEHHSGHHETDCGCHCKHCKCGDTASMQHKSQQQQQQQDGSASTPRPLLKPAAAVAENAATDSVDAVGMARAAAARQQAELRYWLLPWWQGAMQRLRGVATAVDRRFDQGDPKVDQLQLQQPLRVTLAGSGLAAWDAEGVEEEISYDGDEDDNTSGSGGRDVWEYEDDGGPEPQDGKDSDDQE